MERRLTTILTADVAGYSRLMEADEQGTFLALQVHLNELVKPQIELCNGRLIKLMGDGVLAEFASVVNAVNCALTIQRKVSIGEPEGGGNGRIAWRFGIHLGDVIANGDDIHGDGVNVAARLEALAEPGTVCVSRQVMDQVATNLDVEWHDMGPCKVKNISRPIHAFSTAPDGARAPAATRRAFSPVKWIGATLIVLALFAYTAHRYSWFGISLNPSEQAIVPRSRLLPSLAVLPFKNLSEDGTEDYIADGITDDLITDLAKVSGLIIIARNSTFAFKETDIDLKQVAERLGVQYVMIGSLRKYGDRLRINSQLVDASDGSTIWAERYDGNTSDIFALQDDVRSKIVTALKVELTAEEERQLSKPMTDSTEAYDEYLLARKQESFFSRQSIFAAIRHYQRALEIDPNFVAAKARLATAYTIAVEAGWAEDRASTLELARQLANEAIAQDETLPLAYWVLARFYTRPEYFDENKALASVRKALELDPNYADGYAYLSITLALVGKAEEGLAHIETALRLNPNAPFWYYYALGTNQFHLTHYGAAEVSFQKSIERNATWRRNHHYLVSTYGHLDRQEDAAWEMEELRTLGFEPKLESWIPRIRIQDTEYRDRFIEGLRKAGVPEN